MSALRLALVGAPNTGKSTLFNGLTGGRAKVANYAGVTVESRIGRFTTPAGGEVELVDLPGVYGLAARTMDERVTLDALRGARADAAAPDALLVVIDAQSLRTHLHTALVMKTLGRPMMVVLNLIDLAERDGVKIDINTLEARLGVPVIATRATRAAGRAALLARIDAERDRLRAPPPSAIDDEPTPAQLRALQREARAIADEAILEEPALNRLTRQLDAIVLHPVAGPVILAGLLFVVFQAVFAWSGPPMDLIEASVGALGAWMSAILPDTWVRGLVVDGMIAGVGSVVIFLPQIVILFAFILALEASGYMARAAFLMDELMMRVGLNGRAFIPLLSSFACAIPGIMAARTIESERDRLTTILIAPLMTCSARLPVYTLIIAAFIPPENVGPFGLQGLVMFGLYVAGIVSAVIVAFIFKRTLAKGASQPLLMEMPTYKLPDVREFLLGLGSRIAIFLRRAGTIIFAVSILLWLLATTPTTANGLRGTFAGMIGGVLEPILRPIGFNLEISIALVPGMAAREVAVGALGTVYAITAAEDDVAGLAERLQGAWSLPTALAFLAWYVFAPQCASTIAVARRETNSRRWAAFMLVYLFVLAYVAAGATYWIARGVGL